jgi:hypothetical protein
MALLLNSSIIKLEGFNNATIQHPLTIDHSQIPPLRLLPLNSFK